MLIGCKQGEVIGKIILNQGSRNTPKQGSQGIRQWRINNYDQQNYPLCKLFVEIIN